MILKLIGVGSVGILVFVFLILYLTSTMSANKFAPDVIPHALYPTPERDESIQDTYAKSVVIKDPYRWMENPDDPRTKKFIKDEMAITKPYLEKSPFRAELTARYRELWNYTQYVGPLIAGKRYFAYHNTGSQNQDVLYMHESPNDEGKVFLDPNILSEDGTVALETENSAFSPDGLIFGYLTSENGSTWNTLRFKHVEQDDIYKEKLTKVKFSKVTWTKDNKGVFYSAIPDHIGEAVGTDNNELRNHKLFYHVLGTEQSEDVLVVEFPANPNYFVTSSMSDDGKYLIVDVSVLSDNLVYVADLDKINHEIRGKLELIPIVTEMKAHYEFVTNTKNQLVFRTNKNANNYKLIVIDVTKPDPSSWKDLVPENKKNVMEWALPAWYKYVAVGYSEDVKSVLQLHDLASGKMVKKFNLEIGAVYPSLFYSNKNSTDIFFYFVSFLTPGTVYHCDVSKPSFDLEIIKEIKLPHFDPSKYVSEQVFYDSKDGTKIPMYLIHKKGFKKNRNNFTFLTAYGGFGYTSLPYFSLEFLSIVDNFDGVCALANIRGGGEYGENWHKAGSLDKKQNGFDDFQAAAEFLINENYTRSELLAINGLSNGGLLMAATLNQRPDLFGAVIIDVGLTDMLRYYKFVHGPSLVAEYGNPSKDDDFQYLIKYSPLHNIKIPSEPDKQYPPTFLTTSDHDDIVPPLHSLKFIATLQYEAKKHPNQKNPLIIRIDENAGHGQGKTLEKIIADFVDMMCFIIINTGIKFHSS